MFAPLTTMAMRNVDPRLAGAASGVLNTVRQVGLVIGTAAVGALLQNRLVSAMTAQARIRSAALPAPVRGRFIAGFESAARNGIQVGAGQNGAGPGLIRPGTPPGLAAQLGRIGHEVFTFGFVAAMRSTMVLPIVLLAVAAASCFMITRQARPAEAAPTGVAVTEAQSGR